MSLELLDIDNEDYKDQINDLYPIEIYVSNKTNIRKLFTRAYKTQSKKRIELNYNRLKQFKQKQIRRSKK